MLGQIRSFRRNTWLYLVAPGLIGFTIFGGIYTLLLNLYLLRLGYDATFVGVVNGTGFLSLSICAIPMGEMGNRIGLRRSMIVGILLAMTGYGGLPMAEWMPAAIRPIWLIGCFVIGYSGLTAHIAPLWLRVHLVKPQ